MVDIGIKQNQSGTGEQKNISTEAPNLIHPKVCIEQWRKELISMEDTLYCIDDYKDLAKS